MTMFAMLIAGGHEYDDDADECNGKWWWSLRSPDNGD